MALLGPSRLDRQLKKKKEMFLWLFRAWASGPGTGRDGQWERNTGTVQTGTVTAL
jgi:hypothetical protein